MGLVLIDERISIRKANPMNTARIPLDLTKLSCGGEFLSNFIESYFEPAHLRDACTRKHLIANFLSAKRGGFESMHDLIGMTPKELWGPDAFQRRDQLNMDPIVASDEIKNVTGWQILKRKPYSAGALSASIDLFLILMELLIFKSSKNSNFEFIQQQSGCSFDGLARFNPSLTLFKNISSLSKILSHKESHSKNFGAF